ncbi:MAG: hypothetical protein AW11_00163 [Candidatus Accumulibacter regalis]|uniref:Uncharacterized protein n=1 Tax=Accumulibacter regalis TaxID=522306 RepID=A0A011QPX9_ACCRE|nr:MAG: hypothetical protein AW11_00163 [Candidatus Accumulibacter regalis]
MDRMQGGLPLLDQGRVQPRVSLEDLPHGLADNAACWQSQRLFEGTIGEQVAQLGIVAADDRRQIVDQRLVRLLPLAQVGRPLPNQFLGHCPTAEQRVQIRQQQQGDQRPDQRHVADRRRAIGFQPGWGSFDLYRPHAPADLDVSAVAQRRRGHRPSAHL